MPLTPASITLPFSPTSLICFYSVPYYVYRPFPLHSNLHPSYLSLFQSFIQNYSLICHFFLPLLLSSPFPLPPLTTLHLTILQLVLFLALVAVASAARPNYNFNWAVRDGDSGNNYGQQETRNLEDTEGSYSVLLPDGRLQTVNYVVNGDSGFIADVKYSGEARFSDSHSFESFESRGGRRSYYN